MKSIVITHRDTFAKAMHINSNPHTKINKYEPSTKYFKHFDCNGVLRIIVTFVTVSGTYFTVCERETHAFAL